MFRLSYLILRRNREQSLNRWARKARVLWTALQMLLVTMWRLLMQAHFSFQNVARRNVQTIDWSNSRWERRKGCSLANVDSNGILLPLEWSRLDSRRENCGHSVVRCKATEYVRGMIARSAALMKLASEQRVTVRDLPNDIDSKRKLPSLSSARFHTILSTVWLVSGECNSKRTRPR